jgi:two-component system OmpR family sensor kinase
MGRALFWRIYLTLLASLVVAALLVAGLWRLAEEWPFQTWSRVPVRFLEAMIPAEDQPPGIIQLQLDRLARAIDGDVTLYAADGTALASAGEPLLLHGSRKDDAKPPRPDRRVWSFRLRDGRLVLARFDLPFHRPVWLVVLTLLLIAVAVGAAALPIVARLTRRLERLRRDVERWGAGDLALRAAVAGRDEIAAVGQSFNRAADRIEALLAAHRSLLANASHELRSPLTRLGLAIELPGETPGRLAEIRRNLAELDQLIDEILLASRLDHLEALERRESVDLLALAAEEAARTGAAASGEPIEIAGDPRLLRRLVRNLLENAVKHGAPPVEIVVGRAPGGRPVITVRDRGPGIPAAERDRLFEPFHRPAGRGEAAGSWGLGLSLVRQIAERHGGNVRCESRAEGGSAFVVELGEGAGERP